MKKLALWGWVVAVIAVAMAMVVVRGPQTASAQGVALDQSLIALLPPNATSLVGVDVNRIKGTVLYRHLDEQSRKGDGSGRNQLDEFVARTGFDLRRDVDQLLIASWVEGTEPQFVGVARGRFPVANLTQFIRGEKAAVENYRGFQVFGPEAKAAKPAAKSSDTVRVEKQPRVPRRGDDGAFAFLDDRTALAGSRAGVRAAIDRKVDGGPSLLEIGRASCRERV